MSNWVPWLVFLEGDSLLQKSLVVLAIIMLAVLLAVITFHAVGLLGRGPGGERRRYLVVITRWPLTILVLTYVLLWGLIVWVPSEFGGWTGTLETALALLVTATFAWMVMRYIGHVEHRLTRQVQRDGGVNVPLVGEKIGRGGLEMIFRVVRVLIFIIVILTIIQQLGGSITGLLAIGGVGAAVLALSVQSVIGDIFSSLRLFWSRPFEIGDWIRCPSLNVEGVVEAINWQLTQVRTFDRRPLYVPNQLLASAVIENPQRMTNRRIYEYLGVRYSDLDEVPAILTEVRAMIDAHPAIAHDQVKMVNLDRYGAYSVDFFIYCLTVTTNWMEFHDIKEDVLLKIAAIVKKHGADFAFPTQTVHLDQDGIAAVPPIGAEPASQA